MGLLGEIIFTLIAIAGGFLIATFFPVEIRFLSHDKRGKRCLTMWMSEKGYNMLEKTAQDMNTPLGNVLGCALSLLYHAREVYKHAGVLIQEIGDEEAELEITYIDNSGQKVILSGEEKHGVDLSDRDKRILRELGIDPDQTIESE